MTIHDHAPMRPSGPWSRTPERIVIAIFLLMLLATAGRNALDILSYKNFHEELRILYHYDPARTNSKDYAGQFLSKFPQPFLYAYLTKAALYVGVDLILFHKLLGVLCGILLLAGGAVAGLRIVGAVAASAIAVLIAAQPIYHYQISSATPHAFAFPLLIWGLVCLLYQRPYVLAGLTVLSGLLYPPISTVLGLALAWHLLVARKGLSAQNPNRVADVLVLGFTGAISVALLWHQIAPVEGYGAPLPPGVKADLYPENGPDGRHFHGVFNPFAYVLFSTMGQFNKVLPLAVITVLTPCIIAVAGYGLYRLRNRIDFFQPLLSFIIPSLIFCVLIVLLRPYLAYRFVLYPLLTVLPVLFVFGLLTLCNSCRTALHFPTVAIVAVMALLAISLSGTDRYRNFSPLRLDEPSNRLMGFVHRLPPDSLLAAWPGEPQTSLIPYVAARPLLVDFKAHYPTYEGHILNMRARMFDLIDAYLASDIKPLIHLRCSWQVDYLVVDRDHFADEETAPVYFAPFNERIEKILSTAEKSKMILQQPPAGAVVFQAGKFTVLDLALLSDGAACPAQR